MRSQTEPKAELNAAGEITDGYAIGYGTDVAPASILCLRCGRRSSNRRDVAERYCGHCHAYHVRRPDDTNEGE